MATPDSETSAPANYGVADVARECHVPVRLVSDLFYQGRLAGRRCPVVSGRRVIPADYLPAIRRILGKLTQSKGTKSPHPKNEIKEQIETR